MQLRTAALVGVLGLGVGWAVGTRMPPAGPVDAQQGRRSPGPRPLGLGESVPPQRFTEQLRLRLEQQPKAPRPARNPFVFGARSAPAARLPAAAAPAAPPIAPAPSEADMPRPGSEFRLTGMAATEGQDGPVFTAMVHDGRALLFVKQGDVLPGGFEVVDVQESSVTIRDSAGGERTLRLR